MKKEKLKFKKGDKLYTSKGIETKWIFVKNLPTKIYGKVHRRVILVKCICGKHKKLQLNNVRSGNSLCCGYYPCKIPHNYQLRSEKTSYNSLIYAYKIGAKKRNLDYKITDDEFVMLSKMNCYYCGELPSQVYKITDKNKKIRAGIPIIYNGIDRVNNNKGYILNNVVPCCGTCNMMKHAHDKNTFIKKIKSIYEFLQLNKC